ncbi:MAG: S8 family serine peptidase [Lewinellaceae bacterium]|nr:S8 family serine peptidase [Saprospiraceae bacterium]MCB9315618.1 S8 family serine peptidase [Lewinellaceae bacterium]MCB9332072.1 S8 family serine peptidase [Lewinellaceae bacterium]
MTKKKADKATFTYGGVKINVTKSDTEAAVQYTEARERKSAEKRSGAAPPPDFKGFELVSSKRDIGKKLDDLRAQPEVAVGTHVWHVEGEEDAPLIPTGNLYIEFEAGADELAQHELMESMGLSIKEVVGPGAYRVSVTPLSPNPIKCAMQLQENELVAVAEPEFVTTPVTRDFAVPTGRFTNTQWHHENDGQAIPAIDVPNSLYAASHFRRGADAKVREAWRYLGSLGDSNLKIAVIDTGFATDHPQLRGDGYKIRSPFNAVNRNTDVSPYVSYGNGTFGVASHGTSCAAVAAGAWDVQGIMGAAPNAKLMLIKLEVLSDSAIKNAFEHAMLNGADVISCSLGYPQAMPLSTYITNYLRRVAREGRGGKGIPMFFAAGNANPSTNYMPRAVSDFAAHPDGFCITASNSLDQRSSYSFYGSNAFLCAPSNGDAGVGITTATCDLGTDGRSVVLGYTSGFGGTSSSAPLAAGICALMLTANPNLMVADIRNILQKSTDKIGPSGTYDSRGHSDFYGYGRINALRAVQLASSLAGGSSSSGSSSGGVVTTPPVTTPPVTTPASGTRRGRVTSTYLNVRSGPSTAYAKVGRLNQGDVVNLLENVSGFWRIATGQYAYAAYIQELASAAPAPVALTRRGKVTSTFLNVRSGPSTAFPRVDRLDLGDIVELLETSRDGWYRIGANKWVHGGYIQAV